MKRRLHLTWIAALGAAFLGACAQMPTESAVGALQRAQTAMGAAQVNSLAFTASGTGTTFGQAYTPTAPWPKITYSNFSKHYDYANSAMSEEAARVRAEPTGGGAVPLMGTGEQKTSGRLNGEFAWNMTPNPSASPRDVDGRVHDLWTSPHGVLKAAASNAAQVSMATVDGQTQTALSFSVAGRFSAIAYVNAQGLVSRVDAVVPSPVLGDMPVVTWYDDYKDYGGVKFPSRIRQTAAGSAVLDVMVSDVKVNTPLVAAVPDGVRHFKENVVAEKAAETQGLGVWFLAGGSHNSVLIEMTDHAVLVETPLNDGRSLAVLAKARELIPNKPLRYVINSHHHFDHAGGVRTAASQGLTLVTSSAAKPYFEQALANPNRIRSDALATANAAGQAKWSVEGVSGKRTMSDDKRTIEIYEIQGSVHAQGFMMVYLPAEKILIEADAFTPGAPNAPAPTKINDNHLNLASNIQTNSLQVERILPLHGRMVNVAEFNRAIGK